MKRRLFFCAVLCALLMLLCTGCSNKALGESDIKAMVAQLVESEMDGFMLTGFEISDRVTDIKENSDSMTCSIIVQSETEQRDMELQLLLRYIEDQGWQMAPSSSATLLRCSPLTECPQTLADEYMLALADGAAYQFVSHESNLELAIPYDVFTYSVDIEAPYASAKGEVSITFAYDITGGTGWVVQQPTENIDITWDIGGTYRYEHDRRQGWDMDLLRFTIAITDDFSDGVLDGTYNYQRELFDGSLWADTTYSGPWALEAENSPWPFKTYSALVDYKQYIYIDPYSGVTVGGWQLGDGNRWPMTQLS